MTTSIRPVPSLLSHVVRLRSGQRVGVLLGGEGVPLILVPGLSPAAEIYLGPLTAVATLGFKIVAIDFVPPGRETWPLDWAGDLHRYRRIVGEVLDELGLARSVLVGHSLGGRVVTELAATEPERALAVVLLNGAVGAPWDTLAALCQGVPLLAGLMGLNLAADAFRTLASSGFDLATLMEMAVRQALADTIAPWRLVSRTLPVVCAPASTPALDRLGRNETPTFVVHGDADPVVPLAAAHDAARRSRGELVTIPGAAHLWPLADVHALAGVLSDLLDGSLGRAIAGLPDRSDRTVCGPAR